MQSVNVIVTLVLLESTNCVCSFQHWQKIDLMCINLSENNASSLLYSLFVNYCQLPNYTMVYSQIKIFGRFYEIIKWSFKNLTGFLSIICQEHSYILLLGLGIISTTKYYEGGLFSFFFPWLGQRGNSKLL